MEVFLFGTVAILATFAFFFLQLWIAFDTPVQLLSSKGTFSIKYSRHPRVLLQCSAPIRSLTDVLQIAMYRVE